MDDVKAASAQYLLTILLQRIEESIPGSIAEMIDGVASDHLAIAADVPNKEHIDLIFKESLDVLNRAQLS